MYFLPLVGVTCLLCLMMILVNEAEPLSDLGYMYTQVGVLCLTSAAILCLAWWAVEEGDDGLVVGSAVGAGGLMLGLVGFGLARGAVICWLRVGRHV